MGDCYSAIIRTIVVNTCDVSCLHTILLFNFNVIANICRLMGIAGCQVNGYCPTLANIGQHPKVDNLK